MRFVFLYVAALLVAGSAAIPVKPAKVARHKHGKVDGSTYVVSEKAQLERYKKLMAADGPRAIAELVTDWHEGDQLRLSEITARKVAIKAMTEPQLVIWKTFRAIDRQLRGETADGEALLTESQTLGWIKDMRDRLSAFPTSDPDTRIEALRYWVRQAEARAATARSAAAAPGAAAWSTTRPRMVAS